MLISESSNVKDVKDVILINAKHHIIVWAVCVAGVGSGERRLLRCSVRGGRGCLVVFGGPGGTLH